MRLGEKIEIDPSGWMPPGTYPLSRDERRLTAPREALGLHTAMLVGRPVKLRPSM